MPAQTNRHRILEALLDLPPDASVDDAIERLIFLGKIDAGLQELDAGKGTDGPASAGAPRRQVMKQLV